MAIISVPVSAYILSLYPLSMSGKAQSATGTGATLRTLALGLAAPSFWSQDEINRAFVEANRIWLREAEVHFSPVNISERSEAVPADEDGMWARLVNRLTPQGRGIGVGFVFDLPSSEGGWGGGRIAVISGEKVRSGIPGFAGNLLAHELGHVLIDDPEHLHAGDERGNLMHGSRNPRVANAGLLNDRQVDLARARAQSI